VSTFFSTHTDETVALGSSRLLVLDDFDVLDVVSKAAKSSTQKDVIVRQVQVSDPQYVGRHVFSLPQHRSQQPQRCPEMFSTFSTSQLQNISKNLSKIEGS
jgi:hypothetical protein